MATAAELFVTFGRIGRSLSELAVRLGKTAAVASAHRSCELSEYIVGEYEGGKGRKLYSFDSFVEVEAKRGVDYTCSVTIGYVDGRWELHRSISRHEVHRAETVLSLGEKEYTDCGQPVAEALDLVNDFIAQVEQFDFGVDPREPSPQDGLPHPSS